MPALSGRVLVPSAALLLLASCSSMLYTGQDNYREGMRHLRYDPNASPEYFAAAEQDFADALKHDNLEPQERVMAATMRARCLIELERHQEVPAALSIDLPNYDPSRSYPGDMVGLALLKASKLDPERAYAELLLCEKKAATLKSRTHLAWEEVRVLQRINTPKAKAEAIRICAAHAGKIDFDDLKRALEAP